MKPPPKGANASLTIFFKRMRGRSRNSKGMVGRKALEIEFLTGGAEKRTAVEKRVHLSSPGPTVSGHQRLPCDGRAALYLLRRPAGES